MRGQRCVSGNIQRFHLTERQKRIKGKETGLFVGLPEWDRSLVVVVHVVQVMCNSCRVDCIFVARIDPDVSNGQFKG
jgi:hypothetical protein